MLIHQTVLKLTLLFIFSYKLKYFNFLLNQTVNEAKEETQEETTNETKKETKVEGEKEKDDKGYEKKGTTCVNSRRTAALVVVVH